MNKEDYVSLEVAKLLKEKGYNEDCNTFIVEESWGFNKGELTCVDKDRELCSCPTLYEAAKWLRNEKGLYVEVSYMSGDYYIYDILTIPQHDLIGLRYFKRESADTYEGCLNAGILEALKLI